MATKKSEIHKPEIYYTYKVMAFLMGTISAICAIMVFLFILRMWIVFPFSVIVMEKEDFKNLFLTNTRNLAFGFFLFLVFAGIAIIFQILEDKEGNKKIA